jgi:hypothetical protein
MKQTFNKIVYASLLLAGVLSSSVVLAKTQVSSTAQMAQMSKREQLIRQILKETDVEASLKLMIDRTKADIADASRSLVSTLLKPYGIREDEAPTEVWAIVDTALARYYEQMNSIDLVGFYAQFYGREMDEADLKNALKFYQSKAGKKESKGNKTVMTEFYQAFRVKVQTSMQEQIAFLTPAVKEIMESVKSERAEKSLDLPASSVQQNQ